MDRNTAMIERRQRAAPVGHQAGVPTVASPSAMIEIDRGARPGVAPSPAVELGPAETSVSRADVIPMRARRLLAARIRFVGHPSFDDAAVAAEILGPMPTPDGGQAPRSPEPLEGFSSSAELTEPRLLSREQEVHLFRKMNFLKSVAARLRAAIDPDQADAAEIDQVEALLLETGVILNRIIGANQGLVVSVVKKYAGRGRDFFELLADGNVALLRAAERFDFARGVRFSTYATWAILRELAREVRKEKSCQLRIFTGREDLFQAVADHRGGDLTELTRRERLQEAVRSLLGQLDDRERTIIVRRFGLFGDECSLMELGRELGISKERVRQIESRALRLLRGAAEIQGPGPADG
jgi:RNA polymerase primary sigma factor